MTQRTANCAPWCTRHNDATAGGLLPADPDDGICTTPIPAPTGTLRLTWNPLDGLAVRLPGGDELTIADLAAIQRSLAGVAA